MNQPLAYIHPEAQIHPSVQIGPFVCIERDVIIGEGTRIDANVTICEGTRIGRNCHIFPSAVVGAIPQDLKFAGEQTYLEIGDNTVIRECATLHRGTASKGKTVVGSNNLIMAYSHVAHDCVLGNHIILSNATQLAGEVVVDDWAILGGGTLVHQFTHIGSHAMIQGGSRINKDVPPFVLAAREPVQYCGINSVGLRRRGFTLEQISAIQDVYRIIYDGTLTTTEAIERAKRQLPESNERDKVLSFIQLSPRGIIKGN